MTNGTHIIVLLLQFIDLKEISGERRRLTLKFGEDYDDAVAKKLTTVCTTLAVLRVQRNIFPKCNVTMGHENPVGLNMAIHT